MNTTPQAPYFGSFDARRHYTRVLFKPGVPVQARELNDLQASAQHQLGVLSSHIFKNGSRVSGARTRITRVSYVRLQDLYAGQAPVVDGLAEGMVVRGVASGVTATLVAATPLDTVDPATLYVSYVTTGIDGVQASFIPGEDVVVSSGGQDVFTASVRCPACPGARPSEIYPLGAAVFFFCDDGIFYYNETFVGVDRQALIVSKYPFPDQDTGSVGKTVFAGVKIGLDFVEDYVGVETDVSLYDNALGYPNEGAAGADRLRSRLLVSARSYDDSDGDNFILLARIDTEGRVDWVKSDAEYSAIMDAIATRTYETSGNYTVRPFGVRFLNHRRETPGDTTGWISSGSDDNLVAVVSPSVGYVLGYRVETTVETPVVFPKARQTKRLPGAILPFPERAYVVMTPSSVIWPNPVGETGMVSSTRVVLWDAVGGTGNQIGSMLVYNVMAHDGDPGAPLTSYRYYFNDLQMVGSRRITEVRSATVAATNFTAAAVLDDGVFVVRNPLNTSLIYKLPFDNVKTLKSLDSSNPGTMIMTTRKKFRATLDAAGNATITATTNQSFTPAGPATIGLLTSAGGVTTPLPSSAISVSSNSVSISAGSGEAGKTVTVFLDTLITNQMQNIKSLVDTTFVSSVQPPNTPGARVKLGAVDVFAVEKVEVYDHSGPTPVLLADVTGDWKLVSGVTDYAYTESAVERLTLTTSYSPDARLHVKYKAFSHAGTTGFYTVDSYAQMTASVGGADPEIDYEDLPVFTDTNNVVYPLAACIDFRPDLITGSTLEPVIPASGSTAIYEVEFYLPRTDLLQLRKDGTLYVKQGLPSETPRPPLPDDDAMALYQIWLRPYTYDLRDVSTKFIENRRYTMRDIGKIESRVEKLEYYTTLSLLEAQTAAMSTKDAAGFDRYKNGFLVDDFSGFKGSDLSHPEFKAAVDSVRRELRPSFKTRSVKLIPNKAASTGVKWIGGVAIRNFVEERQDFQPFATKHISVNPYFQVAVEGRVVLDPNVDTWSDDTVLPAITTEIDSGVEALRSVASASGVLGTTWGAWQAQNRTILGVDRSTSTSTSSSTSTQGLATTVSTTRTTTERTTTTVATDFVRNGVERSIGSRTQTYTTGEMVKDVTIIPYIREQVVKFYASKLKPNTRVYAFFDSEAVSEFCRSLTVNANASNVATSREALRLGAPMYTDENGELFGEFVLPGGRFFTGQKTFRLSADANFEDIRGAGADADAETTYAEALFFAGGLDVTKQESRLNIITPTFSAREVSEGKTEVTRETTTNQWSSTSSSTTFAPAPAPVATPVSRPAPAPAPIRFREQGGQGGRNGDPVAQSFVFPEDRFVTGLDVFFQAVDTFNKNFWVELRSMVNGYPSSEVLARKDYTTDVVPVSDDATAAFSVKFDFPVFTRGGVEYCFVVGGWTPDTRIWVSKMGGKDVTFPEKTVETQPSLGSSFRSQNGTTWNAEQFEDIKYNIYVARFTSGDMEVVLENAPLGVEMLPSNPIELESGSTRARIFHPAHGFVEGDRVTLDLLAKATVELEVAGTPPQVGQVITTATGSAKITAVTPLANPIRYQVSVAELTGRLSASQGFSTGDVMRWSDNFLLDSIEAVRRVPSIAAGTIGTVITASHAAFPSEAIGGISVDAVQKNHIVVAVDSTDSYIVDFGVPSVYTGRIGGDLVGVRDTAIRYEVVNVSGSSMGYSSGETWGFTPLGHGRAGSLYAGDNYRQLTPVEFGLGSDIHMIQPLKIANASGESTYSVKSLVVKGSFTAYQSAYVTPVVNTDAFSAITVTSLVDYEDAATMNVAPNSSNRWVAETDPVNGSTPYKYVSVTARLKEPASDLRILLDVYKDVNATFDVYVKTLNESESVTIDSKPWRKLTLPAMLDSVDLTDMKEVDLITSDNLPGWGVDETFVAYKVKITGRTKNPCKPPIFKNLRTIAVT